MRPPTKAEHDAHVAATGRPFTQGPRKAAARDPRTDEIPRRRNRKKARNATT